MRHISYIMMTLSGALNLKKQGMMYEQHLMQKRGIRKQKIK